MFNDSIVLFRLEKSKIRTGNLDMNELINKGRGPLTDWAQGKKQETKGVVCMN